MWNKLAVPGLTGLKHFFCLLLEETFLYLRCKLVPTFRWLWRIVKEMVVENGSVVIQTKAVKRKGYKKREEKNSGGKNKPKLQLHNETGLVYLHNYIA